MKNFIIRLLIVRSVGKGAFGKVRIIQKKDDKKMYALKYINKEKCIKMKAVDNIIQERILLENLEHPFIVNMRYAFQDDENMFMVIDLMLGGDLRYHLDRQFNLPEKQVRFYAAEISEAIRYLHSNKVVHRDLKPDNLLLDENGHVHITDFNIAVYLPTDDKLLKSVAGTMAYMAPEILEKKGYLQTVDWWSLGVLLFECVFGKRPFRGKTNDALIQSICEDNPHFPEPTPDLSGECIDFIKNLLIRNPVERLGCRGAGFEEIKAHPWFQDLDWDLLVKKELTAPFIPDQKRANFDATYELEELLLEDNPLKAKKRQYKPGETKLSKEMQIIEDKFTPFCTNATNGKKSKTAEAMLEILKEAEKLEKLREENPNMIQAHLSQATKSEMSLNGPEGAADAKVDGELAPPLPADTKLTSDQGLLIPPEKKNAKIQ
ncbi:kinase-like protein [Rozella allomycis CSF55]|uniref:Kinase-like protein n=1 Tax=Rozella allomycis (strain CSF55) TaxID=988480 RepID=A0A075ASB3_ROZAC|nr:Protein kinase, catalytic domain-containing protein [Rozella allomycis CSF55]RKP20473.1 kinase-like protein [Rozella allomycis CSF55]|eukprot:EPZ33161.1 Protein kinase, catalytic domain-containing protein [Rozella allomycis CSF55]